MGRIRLKSSVTFLLLLILLIALAGCSSTNSTYEQEMQKDEYLKNNFPAKKDAKSADTPVKTTLDR